MVLPEGQGRVALSKYFLKQILGRDSNGEASETHSPQSKAQHMPSV